jgi:hypothetical protein
VAILLVDANLLIKAFNAKTLDHVTRSGYDLKVTTTVIE